MSGNSSGSDYPGGGSSPEEIKPSVPEAGEGTEGKIDNACNSQAHSTTHCTQSETNQDLTGESDTPSSAQSQSKGEIIIDDGKLADDNEKGEKNKVTPREQDKVVHYAMQRAQNDNQFSNNYQDENFCAEKGRGLIVATVADQCEQYNRSRNAQADEVSTENFEKNGKHMVAKAAADVDHKIETGEHTSYENNKQMDQEDEKRSASPKQTLDQRNGTPSKSESVNLNQGDRKPTTPQTASSLAKSLQSTTQTENPNQENGTPSTSQMENPIQGDGKPSSSQTENSNQGGGKPSSSQVINPNQGNGKPTTPQTENQNKENGTPSTSLMDIPNKGNGIPSTPQTENPNEGDGKPSLSQTENSNQGGGKLSSTQANDPNQGDGTPSSSQTENPNQGDGKLSSTQANDPNQGDGKPSLSQTENPNQGDGTPSLSQTENPNQGDGTPSTSQTKNPNQEDSIPSTSQTENLNQENGTPSTLQTMNPNQGDGKATTPQPKNSNQENGTPSTPQRENPNQGDGTPSISQTVNPNQEDSIPSISQTENPKQEDGIPSTSQTKNSNQGNGIPSVIGDRIHLNIDKGTSDNTEKGKNDRTSELDAWNLHKSDEDYRTTEEERQYAITKTQLSQSGIQVTEYANGQIEEEATCSEHPHILFSFSQSQADFTVIEYQLEQVIDKILNDCTLHENKEEWKKNAKKEIMVFLLSIVKDGTLSRRSFHPCVTHSMPIQIFDSDIHVAETSRKDAEKARAGERLSTSAHTRPKDSRKHDQENLQRPPEQTTPSVKESSQTVAAKSGKTKMAPNPVADGVSFSQSSLPRISTDSRKHDKLPYIDDQENPQRPPEQTTPSVKETSQTVAAKSLHGMIGKQYAQEVGALLNSPLTTFSSKRMSSDPEYLDIQWKSEQNTGVVEHLVIPLYHGRTIRYYIRISCLPADYYRLKFMFQNTNTTEDLSDRLSKIDCSLKTGTDEIYLRSSILQEKSKVISDKIEDIIIKVTSTIHVHCTVVGFAKDNLVEKCKRISPECCKGNIAVYEQDEHVWIVGRDENELEILKKQLTDENILQKASYSLKDILRIALGEKEKKFGPIKIGSSDEIKEFEIECNRADFYKLYLIFDKAFLEKNDAVFRSTGKVPIVISINSAAKKAAGDWVDFALRDVESFVKRMLPLISAKCQKLSKTAPSLVDLCKEKVLEYYDGELQVYADEDDDKCLWFVCKDYHLIEKSIDILASEDLIEKTTSALPDHDHGSQLIAHPLTFLQLGICMQFNISAALKDKHEKNIVEIYIDKSKSELKISIMNINGSVIRSDIEKFLRERMATRSIVRNIPNCCIPFLKIPAIRKEIDTKLPFYIDVQHNRRETEVYSDTKEHAKEVVCIIEGLFQQKKVVVEDFDTSSLILKLKVEEWRKEFSEKIGIELTTKQIEVWGLRPSVEEILLQLESYIQQQRKPPFLEVNVKDEPDSTSLLKQDFVNKGKFLIYKEKEVKILQTPAFKRKMKEIQEKHQCSIQIETENAYPLRKETSLGTQWQFQSGKNVVFNQTDVLDVETNRTECIVQFIPETITIKPGAGILYEKANQIKNIIRVIVSIPIWRDGEYKEKEQLRNCILLLFQSLYDKGFSSVTIPLMIDSVIQWPERKLLNQILYLRRHFPETAVFCHPIKGNYEKLLPIFEDLKEQAEKKEIFIKIQKKRFTDMKVQVLVNTVGWDLKLEQGHVSYSILNVAGKEIQTEANRKCPNGLNRGEVLVTDAYNLRDRGILKVFHGSLLPWGGYESIAAIKLFVAKCLNLATEYGMTSIAFPALGTGNLGYPHKAVATAMFETVRSFIEGSVYTSVQEVVFNVFDEKSQEAFFTEEKKYLNFPCRSATFLPRIYKFPLNDLTFELYCGEVWTQDVKGLAVLYESSNRFDQDDKVCLVECGKKAQQCDEVKQKLQSGGVYLIKQKVSRPIKWVFHLTWHQDDGLKLALATLKSAEDEKLDSMAFVISKKDAVAGQLPDVIKSVFGATEQFKRGSFLKKVIFVVDPFLTSVAYKTVEGPVFELYDTHKQRCHVWFKCNTHNGLQNAKEEILSVLDSLSGATSDELYDYETSAFAPKDTEKDNKSEKSLLDEKWNELHTQCLTQEKRSGIMRSAENCSLILSIVNKAFFGQDEAVTKETLQKAVHDAYIPVKIIFPFLNKRDALLKFKENEELCEFRKCFHHDYLQLKDFPEQAVTCLSATVSKTAKTRFFEQGWTEDDITERSGVAVKNQNGSLVLEGSLLEVQAAREFILNACQSKSPTRDIQNSAIIKNASLDYENSFVNEKTNIRTQNKFSQPEKSNLETKTETKKTDVVWKKDDNRKKNLISQNSSDFGNQTSSVIPEKLNDPSAFSAGSVKLKEPANLSMRQKEKLRIPHLDYAILETIFPVPTDISGKVVVNKNSEEFVEVLGTPETVQPFIETMKSIRVLQKIPIEIDSKDFSQIEKNFLFHQKNIHTIFPTAHILVYERKMFLIKPEDVDKAAVLDVLFSAREKRVAGERTKRILKDQVQSSQMSSPSPQTTFGNPVLEKGDSRVYVVHGDVFSFDLYDCFVNPTNEFLNLETNGGLSAAVHKRAGEDVQKECRIKLRSRKLKVGDCVYTGAGNLKYKAIIHTVVEHWKNLRSSKYSVQTAMDHIKDVVMKCCELASKKKMTSIVFPAFGSGQSAIPSIILANGYRLGCKFLMHGKGSQQLKNIFFVIDNYVFLSLVEMTFRTPLPWCSYEPDEDEYTYHMPNWCSVVVAKRDVLHEKRVDALVVLETPSMSGNCPLASKVLKTADYSYKHAGNKGNQQPGSALACKYKGTLDYKTIVYIIMKTKWGAKEVELYKQCISNALSTSEGLSVSIAMQLFIGGTKDRELCMHLAKALTEAVVEYTKSKDSSLRRILILNQDPLRHELVKEEFHRYTKQSCQSNSYFEREVFLNCDIPESETLV